MAEEEGKVEQYLAVTGQEDETVARGYLQAAGWDLETAINNFFSGIVPDTAAPAGGGGGAGPGGQSPPLDADDVVPVDYMSETEDAGLQEALAMSIGAHGFAPARGNISEGSQAADEPGQRFAPPQFLPPAHSPPVHLRGSGAGGGGGGRLPRTPQGQR